MRKLRLIRREAMSAAEQVQHEEEETISAETVRQLMAEAKRYKAALEAIVEQAGELNCRLPDVKHVPRNLALGSVLTLSGLAEAALE